MSKRYLGYVTGYYPEKGYGFIRNRRDGNCYFVYFNQVMGDACLCKGDIVEFSIGINKKNNQEQATKVIVVENR